MTVHSEQLKKCTLRAFKLVVLVRYGEACSDYTCSPAKKLMLVPDAAKIPGAGDEALTFVLRPPRL